MKNKKIWLLAVVLFGSAFFTATQPITPEMAIVSSISVILFALPTYIAIVKTAGKKRGLALLAALGVYALLLESSAILTGFPYGNFVYTDVLGNKVFGVTPWTVAFAYPPILLLAYWFARLKTDNRWKLVCLTAVAAMSIDLVLDPAAVRLGFWYWENGGFFYNVPLVNFLGWLLSGFLGAIIVHQFYYPVKLTRPLTYSGMAIVWFWTSVNVWLMQIIPAVIGIVILFVIFRNMKHLR